MRLDTAGADGITLRTHLQRAARAGTPDAMLLASRAPLPRAAAPLWETFLALRSGGAVTHVEMRAWEQINRVRLSPWEAETLLHIDRAARRIEDANSMKGGRA